MEKILEVKNLSKDYVEAGYKVHLLQNISFDVELNSITSIIAPTGAGKSALLKILSGLETPTEGSFEIKNQDHKLFFIPSKPSSFPWYSVKENLDIGNKDNSSVQEIIKEIGLEGYENHFPDNDSIAFRCRIAVGRAISSGNNFIALDEPFSKKINPVSLERLYSLILELREKRKLTFLVGTSNISEAILLSDKIYVLQKDPGKIVDSFGISFDEPRIVNLYKSEKFISYRNQIEAALKMNKSQILSNISI